MKHARLAVLTVSFGIALLPILAQRAPSTTYDPTRKVKFSGSVTRIDWSNPGAFLFVNVKDTSGITSNWAVEIGPALDLEQGGWKRDAVRIGDVVTVEGIAARDPARQTLATSVVLNNGNKKLFTPSNKKQAKVSGPTPKWPDGHPRLGPVPGKSGYWKPAGSTALVETGVNVVMNKDGLLANITDAGKVAPFQPWAQGLYEYRQRNLFKDDPYNKCIPPGGPRQFQNPYGFQIVEQPEIQRVLILLAGGNRNFRMVQTDGRPMGQKEELVLTYYGTSVGKWDGDTLVVDTVGFNDKFWFSNGGLPHTEALHLTEKFTRTDLSTLKYQVTVDDNLTYTRPWTGGWNFQWTPDEEIQEYFCEDNAEQLFVR